MSRHMITAALATTLIALACVAPAGIARAQTHGATSYYCQTHPKAQECLARPTAVVQPAAGGQAAVAGVGGAARTVPVTSLPPTGGAAHTGGGQSSMGDAALLLLGMALIMLGSVGLVRQRAR